MVRYEPRYFDGLFEEFNGASDRAAILVAGSLLDDALGRAIAGRLRNPPPKGEEWDILFGTFQHKILAAFYLKVIGRKTRREIELVRKIRNVAAHDMNPISFDGSPEIANRCRELRLAMEATNENPTKRSLRERFLHTPRLYIIGLTLRASNSTNPSKLDAAYLDG